MVSKGLVAGVVAVVAASIAGYFLFIKGVAGGLAVTISNPSVAQGANLNYVVSGATPNGQVTVSVTTNTGSVLAFTPNLTALADGTVSATFTVGTNIPTGSNTLNIVDVTTGKSATATFTVS